MPVEFSKYHGAGNDFILLDDREGRFPVHDQKPIQNLCSRRFGIGADGLILIRRASSPDAADFRMVYFNADGREGSLCGNGARCAALFARDLEWVSPSGEGRLRIEASDGAHDAELLTAGRVRVGFRDFPDPVREGEDYVVDTGSPHVVFFRDPLDAVDVEGQGKSVRNRPRWGEAGVNVDFVAGTLPELTARTYERGVEAETLACGTGAVAVAAAGAVREGAEGEQAVRVRMPGGDLLVEFVRGGGACTRVALTGPAAFVFRGEVDVP